MSNEQQITYWNEVAGPKWIGLGGAMEERLEAINGVLLAACAPQPGERALDIGCGTGVTALRLAEAVTPAGRVVGVDVSLPMLEDAHRRGAGQPNIAFLQADAQLDDFGGAKFDLIVSRFGVMFFADPTAAFTNLRRALTPGGRLCVVTWAALSENTHWRIPFDLAVATLGPPEPKPPRAPGPLALSAPGYVRDILVNAGFSDISITPVPVSIIGKTVEDEARIACIIGPTGPLLDEKQADDAVRADLRAQIAAAFLPFDTAEGPRLPATVLLVNARF